MTASQARGLAPKATPASVVLVMSPNEVGNCWLSSEGHRFF